MFALNASVNEIGATAYPSYLGIQDIIIAVVGSGLDLVSMVVNPCDLVSEIGDLLSPRRFPVPMLHQYNVV